MNPASHSVLKPIPRAFSVYLDLLRWGAATMVLLFHMQKLMLGPAELLQWIPDRGHDFVIVFFVMSGYVIAATADRKKEAGFRTYLIDRMARIYSVAFPVLMMCSLMAICFYLFDPTRFSYGGLGVILKAFWVNLFFGGEIWFNPVRVFLNVPYWSLCYEVLYYIGFGMFFFFRGWKRLAGVVFFVVLAGPKILLLMPCWLIGCLIYFYRDKWVMTPKVAFLFAVLMPIAIAMGLHWGGFGEKARMASALVLGADWERYEFSKTFLVDWVVAIILAAHIYAVRYLPIAWPVVLEKIVVWGASMSFTLYLFHQPVLMLVKDSIHMGSQYQQFFGVFFGVLLVAYLFSMVTERQKNSYRAIFEATIPKW